MANFALISPTIWVHDMDMSGYLHKVNIKATVAELENTTFGSGGYRSRIGGLKTVSLAGDGYWDSTPDASLFGALGTANRVFTISPQGAATNVAYLWRAGEFVYDVFGAAGSVAPFNISAMSSDSQGLIRGQVAALKQNVSATGAFGSILTMTGPSASQFLYATIHVFTAATTITIIVESATTLGFAGPTTRATIGPITVVGGTWLVRVAGPITDGFWRLNASGVTGTFSIAGAIGIQ